MPTPDPSASLTPFQAYQVARDAVVFDYGRLGLFSFGLGVAILAFLLAAVLVAVALRR